MAQTKAIVIPIDDAKYNYINELASKYQDYSYVPDYDLGWFTYKEEVLECWEPNCKPTVINWDAPGGCTLKVEGPTKALITSFVKHGYDPCDIEEICELFFIKK